jgi:osmotically-inducible protein OsmY
MRIHTIAAALALALPAAAMAQSSTTTTTTTTTGGSSVATSITGGTGSGVVSSSGVVINTEADRQLLGQIVSALSSDPAAEGAAIDVQVVGGRVTLNGIARTQAQVEAVKGIAQGIAGSANVASNLTSGRQ